MDSDRPADEPLCLFYARASTRKQDLSPFQQQELVEAYHKARADKLPRLGLEYNLIDAGRSGGVPLKDRPAGARLIEIARPGDIIICAEDSRFGRDTVDSVEMARWFKAKGVAIHFLNFVGFEVDTSSSMGEFFLTIAMAFATLQRRQIGERTKRGVESRTQLGIYQNRRFGMKHITDDNGNRILVANEEEIRVIKQIEHLYFTRRWGTSRIATHFNHLGIKKFNLAYCTNGKKHKPNPRWSAENIEAYVAHIEKNRKSEVQRTFEETVKDYDTRRA